jgi:hypothetical protein
MIIFEILEAIFKLGMPVGLLSWYLINRLYDTGRIAKDADMKTIRASLDNIKKDFKQKKKSTGFAEKKWMKFGGGFYGITALATFVLIELGEGISFILNFPGFGELFKDGLGSFIINLLLNQFQNFISALVWFAYWVDEEDSIFIWVGVPYLAYLCGMLLAGRSWKKE